MLLNIVLTGEDRIFSFEEVLFYLKSDERKVNFWTSFNHFQLYTLQKFSIFINFQRQPSSNLREVFEPDLAMQKSRLTVYQRMFNFKFKFKSHTIQIT